MKEDKYTVTMSEDEAKRFYLTMVSDLMGPIRDAIGFMEGEISHQIHRIWDSMEHMYDHDIGSVENFRKPYELILEAQESIIKTRGCILNNLEKILEENIGLKKEVPEDE